MLHNNSAAALYRRAKAPSWWRGTGTVIDIKEGPSSALQVDTHQPGYEVQVTTNTVSPPSLGTSSFGLTATGYQA